MKIIDMHSHWGTKRGYVLQTPEPNSRSNARPGIPIRITRPRTRWRQYFRANNVRVILDLGFSKFLPLDEMQSLHDYSFATERAHRDVILGHWFHVDPAHGRGRRQGTAPLHRQPRRLRRLCGVGLEIAAGQRSVLRSVLQIVHRGRHSDSVLRRHHGPGRRACPAATASFSTIAIRAISIWSRRIIPS